MGLINITVRNFKSYLGTTQFQLEKLPFIGVIGPNGSGKSNFLDAVCFVIGMSINELRCTQIGDLVNLKAHASDMFVEARVEVEGLDVVRFKRTSSEYYIDGAIVTPEYYLLEWRKFHVLAGAKNCIVLQNDIESLASAEPEKLAKFIGSAITIAKFAGTKIPRITPAPESLEVDEASEVDYSNGVDPTEYAILKSDMEQAASEMRKFSKYRNSTQAKLDTAQEISETKTKIAEIRSKVRKLERRRVILSSKEKRALLSGLRKQVDDAKKALAECEGEASLVVSDSKVLRSTYARKRRQLQTARQQEREAMANVVKITSQIQPLEKKSEIIMSELRVLEPDLDYARQTMITAKEEVEEAEESTKKLEREQQRERLLQEQESSDKLSSELRQLWDKLNTEFLKSTALDQDKLRLLMREVNKEQEKVLSGEYELSLRKQDHESSSNKYDQCEVRIQQLTTLINERTAQKEERTNELKKSVDELDKCRTEQVDLQEKLVSLNRKLKSADGDKKYLAQRHRLLDAVEKLKLSNKGVFDILGNLVEPIEQRFQSALEQGLGSNVDAIVVSDASVAISCIRQARRERLGILRFLPLSDLQAMDLSNVRSQLSSHLANHSSGSKNIDARLLIDCARVNAQFRPALVYVLGDTVFVPTLKQALNLRKSNLKMRMISSDGASLSTNNLMSITSESALSNTASSRSLVTLERRVQQVIEKKKNLNVKEQDLQDSEMRLSSQIDKLTVSISSAQKELEICEEQISSFGREIRHYTDLCKKAEAEVKSQKEILLKAQNLYNEFNESLHLQRQEAFKPFIDEAGGQLEDWDSILTKDANQILEVSRKRQLLEDRSKLANDRYTFAKEHYSKQSHRYKTMEAQLNAINHQLNESSEKLRAAQLKFDKASEKVKTLHGEVEAKSDEVGAADSMLEQAQQKVADAEHEQTLKIMELSAQLSALDDDQESDEEANSGTEKDSRDSLNKFTDAEFLRDAVSLDKIDEQLTSLRKELRSLNAFMSENNQNSLGDDELISQEYEDFERNYETARSTYDKLTYKFTAMKEARRKSFMEVLSSLQQALNVTYRELVGDGQAQITPINDEEPFEGVHFSVKPAGKTYTSIDRLSGGEQSIAALALLFAFQQIRPAPFVVLDEVDAALDLANVASLAKYLIAHSKDTQFIVVSLKQKLFEHANNLVGVYKREQTSRILAIKV